MFVMFCMLLALLYSVILSPWPNSAKVFPSRSVVASNLTKSLSGLMFSLLKQLLWTSLVSVSSSSESGSGWTELRSICESFPPRRSHVSSSFSW